MSDLIDREALLETMKHRKEYYGRKSDPICLVEDAPSIPAPRWVRCEEDMPKEMKVVVTYGKGCVSFGYYMLLYDYDTDKEVCEWVDTHSNRMEVTHWMPLPEPPREDV